jgi:tRNA pseudouridine32 synthase/23S rRNA pseudouridine746 synthase
MIQAPAPSFVTLPIINPPYPSLIDFFCRRFPNVDKSVWHDRLVTGKILDAALKPVLITTEYIPGTKLYYYREIIHEQPIPFHEEILFQNDHLLVACKPHFLPVTPAGPYIHETLLYRLRKKTGNDLLSPINRIDKDTAGLVLMAQQKNSRPVYQNLFRDTLVYKQYEAVAWCPTPPDKDSFLVENRIVQDENSFRMVVAPGPVNAKTKILFKHLSNQQALFHLEPGTGKKHQLRIHLSIVGHAIINDRYYPDLLPQSPTDFSKPLQLLAKKIRFYDPILKKEMEFISPRKLIFG